MMRLALIISLTIAGAVIALIIIPFGLAFASDGAPQVWYALGIMALAVIGWTLALRAFLKSQARKQATDFNHLMTNQVNAPKQATTKEKAIGLVVVFGFLALLSPAWHWVTGTSESIRFVEADTDTFVVCPNKSLSVTQEDTVYKVELTEPDDRAVSLRGIRKVKVTEVPMPSKSDVESGRGIGVCGTKK